MRVYPDRGDPVVQKNEMAVEKPDRCRREMNEAGFCSGGFNKYF